MIVLWSRHEDLYKDLVSNIIRSDALDKDIVGVERQLEGARVILCTLSMLTQNLISDVVRLVPVQMVSVVLLCLNLCSMSI